MSEIERADGWYWIQATAQDNGRWTMAMLKGNHFYYGSWADADPYKVGPRIHPPDSEEAQRVAGLLAEVEEWKKLRERADESRLWHYQKAEDARAERDALRLRVDALEAGLAETWALLIRDLRRVALMLRTIEPTALEATPDPAPQPEEVKEGKL